MREALLIGLLLSATPAAFALPREEPAPDSQEATIERILELRRELEALLESLPPAARAEVERRWRERRQPEAPDAELAAVPGDVPEPASPPSTPAAVAPPDPPAASGPGPSAEVPTPAPGAAASPPGARASCDTLRFFDSNGDGLITALDRYWRHLRLWMDDGDGRIERGEIERPFELGVREIGVGLRSFATQKGSGDIWRDEYVRFDFPDRQRAGLLMIDADALARGGELRLVDGAGRPISGTQAVVAGVRIETADGESWSLRCP